MSAPKFSGVVFASLADFSAFLRVSVSVFRKSVFQPVEVLGNLATIAEDAGRVICATARDHDNLGSVNRDRDSAIAVVKIC
jgi:hypothetical protein